MREKIHSYIGLAKRSGNIIEGFQANVDAMNRRKINLLIIAENLSERTQKKILKTAEITKTTYEIYSTIDSLSNMAGTSNVGIFGIIDKNFSKSIKTEIDKGGVLY